MGLVSTNTKKGLTADVQRRLIMDCLKETHCPMTADQIREWLRDRRLGTLTVEGIAVQLRILEMEGRTTHPAPEQTLAWTYVRGAR